MDRDSLLARRKELAQKKRKLQEDICRLRPRRRDARPWSRARAEYKNAFVVEVACAIWCQSRQREHVLAYANRHPGRGVAAAEALVQKCEAMSVAEVTERLGASGGRRLRALEIARRFLHGAAMHGWVVHQNRCKGLAPTLEAVWRHGQQAVRSEEPLAPAGPPRGASRPLRPHSRFNALRRWRKRFDIRLGRFPAGAAEPPSTLREKAAGPGDSLFVAKFCEAFFGAFFWGRNPGPFSGPPIGPVRGTGPGIRAHSGRGFCFFFVAGGGGKLKFANQKKQATATWQWCNFLHASARPGTTVVNINLDETCIKLSPTPRRGAVAVPRGKSLARVLQTATQKASLALRRSAFTLVALVCDCPRVQEGLPQILVGSEQIFPARLFAAWSQSPRQDNMYFLRQKTGWVNEATLCQIVRLLGRALRRWHNEYSFVVSLDAYPAHLTAPVARAFAQQSLLMLVLPAGTTCLLQPLDTHVFVHLKRFLGQRLERCRLASASGVTTTGQVVQAVVDGVRHVLQEKSWAHAFTDNGLTAGQRGLRRGLLARLELVEAPSVGAALPGLRQLQHSFGDRRSIPLGWLFRCSLLNRGHSDPMGVLAEDRAGEAAEPLGHWQGRLRSGVAGRDQETNQESSHHAVAGRPAQPAEPGETVNSLGQDSHRTSGRAPRGRRLPWTRTVIIE